MSKKSTRVADYSKILPLIRGVNVYVILPIRIQTNCYWSVSGNAYVKCGLLINLRFDFLAAPKVFVWPMSLVASPNSNVSFQCNATGTPNPVITWTKEGGDIPKRHTVLNGVFNLTQLARVDNGRYMCKATNAAGASGMFVKLTIEG